MGLHDFVKAMPVTKSVCTRRASMNMLSGVWGVPATLTLFEAVSKKCCSVLQHFRKRDKF